MIVQKYHIPGQLIKIRGTNFVLDVQFLITNKIATLRTMHKKSRDKRVSDKIKAVLLVNSGYSYERIAEVLLLDDATIRRWYNRYEEHNIEGLLADFSLGDNGYLTEKLKMTLGEHLENNVYLTAKEICACVLKKYKID